MGRARGPAIVSPRAHTAGDARTPVSVRPDSVDDVAADDVRRDDVTDAGQRAVLDAAADASGVIIGAPGTGKTRTLIERVSALLRAHALTPDEVLVLTPSRQAATVLRDRLGVRVDQATPGPLARSFGSFAFQVVRGAMVHAGLEPPSLLTGADQDRIIADLLAGDAADEEDGLPSRWPESLSPAVRASKGFRSELRAFLSECTELGVLSDQLAASDRETWRAVGSFLTEYRTVLGGMRSAYRDVPDLLSEASAVLRDADAATLGPLAALRVVLIDDAQELTRGGVALVQTLRARGIAVLAFGDPDISSGAFRGASPQLFHELASVLEHVFVLDEPHRQVPALTSLTRSITQAIGAAGRVEHRRAPDARPDDGAGIVTTFLAPSPYEEVDRIAGTLRDWHLTHGIAWSDMAVIAHDTRQVTTLETELAAREVPTRAAGVQRPLGRESVVRDIVGIVRLALQPVDEREPEALAEALRSPFGGMDAVGLRRLRARLRHRELADGGTTSAAELLRRAMAFPAEFTFIDAPEARAAERFATTLAETTAAAQAGETIHELLWRIWENARGLDGMRLQRAWRTAAEQPGGGETARALDALVALFDAAKRFVERTPDEKPALFVRDILDSEVPEDTLSTPERPGLVTLLTPATALGTEFEAVIVAGVQDGVWPNVRLRGGLLETWRLADAVTAARTGEPKSAPEVLDRRRDALHDELRLFVRALSRARGRLLVSAVNDDDAGPSPFFAFLPEPPAPADHPAAEHPLTLRGLVARHRRTLTSSPSATARAEAAQQLSVLAREGVPGADPSEWYGAVPPTTTAPLRDPRSQPVRVSPSRMEAFETCALDWVIRALGGETGTWSAGLGTILHAAMEQHPAGGLAELTQIVESRWGELEFEAPWLEQKERRWAELLTGRLDAYLRRVQAEGGRSLGAEVRFELEIDLDGEGAPRVVAARPVTDEPGSGARAVLSGSIDRVEVYPAGRGEGVPLDEQESEGERVVIVDLKTGRSETRLSDAAVADHAQLAAYQLAFASGAIAGAEDAALAGSRLVVLSKTLKGGQYRIAHQPAHDGETRQTFLRRLGEDARGMAADHFLAQIDTHCHSDRFAVCRVHTVKPVSAS